MAGWTIPISTNSIMGLPSRCPNKASPSPNSPNRARIPVTQVCSDRLSLPIITEPEDNRACPIRGFHPTTEWTLETRPTINNSRSMGVSMEWPVIGRHRRAREWVTWVIHRRQMDIPRHLLFMRAANSKRPRWITRAVFSTALIVRPSSSRKSIIRCTPNTRTCRHSRNINSLSSIPTCNNNST